MNNEQPPNIPYGYDASTPEPTPTPNTPKSSKTAIKATIIVCIILSVAALVLGAFGFIQASNANSEIASLKSELGLDANIGSPTDTPGDALSCTFPTNVDQISYLDFFTNNGNDEFYIEPGYIEYYHYSTDTSDKTTSSNTSVEINTTDILQYLIDNGANDFADLEEEGSENWTWSAELSTTEDVYCLAKGTGTAPTWFNTLVTMADSKIK